MLDVSEHKLLDFTGRYISTVRPALIEHPRKDGSMAAFTDNYLRVNILNPDPSLANQVVPVRITGISTDVSKSVRVLLKYRVYGSGVITRH